MMKAMTSRDANSPASLDTPHAETSCLETPGLQGLIDSHCHLDDPRFDADRIAVCQRAAAAGVGALIVPAVRPATWEPLDELVTRLRQQTRSPAQTPSDPKSPAHICDESSTHGPPTAQAQALPQREQTVGPTTRQADRPTDPAQKATPSPILQTLKKKHLPQIYAAFGIHPQVVGTLSDQERARVAELPARLERTGGVAVGECGLDGPTGHMDVQEALFRQQIGFARDLRLPLIVHVFKQHEAALRVLREEGAQAVGGVLHSYSGGAQLVPRYADLGFAFSFAGAVTWPKARRPLEAVRAVPEDLLLLETDAPDQSPTTRRGSRNEPAHLIEIATAVAHARDLPLPALATLTAENTRRLFAI